MGAQAVSPVHEIEEEKDRLAGASVADEPGRMRKRAGESV